MRRKFPLTALLFLGVPIVSASPAVARDLTFAERVEAQGAIERVYYSHQIGVTRPFEEVVPRAVLERKVEVYLKQNVALEKIWKTPITTEMLRRELTRMSEKTKIPERLRDLYRALGNDSFLIEECLVRPVLVDRLTRSFYAYDQIIHSSARKASESLRRELLERRVDPFHVHPNRAVVDFVRVNPASSRDDRRGRIGPHSARRSARVELEPDEFDRINTRLPSQPGEVGDLEEESDMFVIPVTLKADAVAIKVATYTVPKRSWAEWWNETEDSLPADSIRAVASGDDLLPNPVGGSPNVADLQAGTTGVVSADAAASTCATGNTWDSSSLSDIPYPRHEHTAVWTGSVMIIWGGFGYGLLPPFGAVTAGALSEGWRYDPTIDRWSLISSTDAPKPRYRHTAIWTGTEMIVWGGYGDGDPGSGGRYDPISDTWRAVSRTNAPPGASFATAVWTGTQMLVWGGYDFYLRYASGGSYDPRSDTWRPISSTNAPSGRSFHTTVWTGSQMLVWGGLNGSTFLASGGRYDPVSDTWSTISTVGAPSARYSHTSAWSGELMVVWGGVDNPYGWGVNTGGRYDPLTDTWTPVSMLHAPSGRMDQTVVWTGSRMLIWGGSFATYFRFNFNTGGAYDPISDAWTTISTTNAPQARGFHSAIWTGTLMVIWGGVGYSGQGVSSGGRYDPSSDTWTPTSATNAPSARERHTAVWTGNLMIVWGGVSNDPYGYLQTGGRYDPVTDSWAPTSTTSAPAGRYGHSAVWSGTTMVVWGGTDDYQFFASGGQYDPISDVWVPTSSENAPIPRIEHTTIWTGSEMIVWGGVGFDGNNASYVDTGGRYDPLTDSWTSTNEAGAPTPRRGHTAVWTASSMIVWGGCDSFTCPKTGAMYRPETDTWSAISTNNAPVGRLYHTAVWTGSVMVVWGGGENSGGRYDPSTDSWLPTSTVLAPIGRQGLTAVWTGISMVIWGGDTVNWGGQYDPVKDDWVPTSLVNAPNGRANHSAAWTGAFMIIWGGATNSPLLLNTGGRYCACAVKSYFRDADGDSYGSPDVSIQSCSVPSGYVSNADDCDDTNPAIHPGASEVCNSLDDNCDGRIDEGYGVGDECTAPVDTCHQVVGEIACRADGTGTECNGPASLHDVTSPVINCPASVTLECPVMLAGVGRATAVDVCDPAPTVGSDAPAHLPLGTSVVTWTATDANGNASTCQQTVVSLDTTPPMISCPTPSTTECTGPTGASVNLLATASDECSSTVRIQNDHTPNGADGSEVYPLGTTSVVFNAMDASGNVATCNAPVKVQDTTPPVLAVMASPPTLWPPNHRMVLVQVAWQAKDACDPTGGVILVSATSSESDDASGNGDGNTTGDIQDASVGTADLTVALRAERSADGAGRVYALTYVARDASGNTASEIGIVTVPHDQGTGPEPVVMNVERNGPSGMAHLYWNAVSGAEMYDVIQGELGQVTESNGVIRLGPVRVLASGQIGTSYSEGSNGAIPATGRAFFYLVQYRTGLTASGWGTESSPWPAEPTSCDIGCPGM